MKQLNENSSVGVIGAGTMGSGIAQVAATFGHSVVVYDTSKEVCEKARGALLKILNRLMEKERITRPTADAIFERIRFAEGLSSLSGCDLVIEAIIETLDVKKDVFSNLISISTIY